MPAYHSFYRNVLLRMIIVVIIFCGCNHPTDDNPYPYTPDDFDEPLRDLLKKIEEKNIVFLSHSGCRGMSGIFNLDEYYYEQLGIIASTKDLLKASKSSNPTIRASALIVLMADKTVNPAQLVREHMFDTAQVFDDYDESKWTIISFMLHNSYRWPDKATRDNIRKELLQQNPLEYASYQLMDLETPMDTFPGFYGIIKSMARNLNHHSAYTKLNWFSGIGALNRLASYRYKEDIPLIDSLIYSSLYSAYGQFLPVDAIRNFPAPEFDKYYLDTAMIWNGMFRFLRHQDGINYIYYPEAGFEKFIDLVIESKNQKSALMLEEIWDWQPHLRYMKLTNWEKESCIKHINEKIAVGIRKHYTPFNERLIKKSKKVFNAYVKEHGDPLLKSGAINEEKPTFKKADNKKGAFEAYWFF